MPNSTNPARIPIAGDHAAPELKAALIAALKEFTFDDLGPNGTESVDYPDYAEKVASLVSSAKAKRGILICGSGIGMSIAANKFPAVRAAHAESLEAAKLSREHNDANILCLGARLTPAPLAIEMVRTFLTTDFSNQPRHCGRVDKITALEARFAPRK
jgi:RpiB/LacA/LacB family sugar-phosphate isomerase